MKEFIKYAHEKNMNSFFRWLIMNLCWLVCYKLSHSYAIFWFGFIVSIVVFLLLISLYHLTIVSRISHYFIKEIERGTDLRSVYCEKLYDVETLGKIGDVSKKMEYVLEKNLKVKWYYSSYQYLKEYSSLINEMESLLKKGKHESNANV